MEETALPRRSSTLSPPPLANGASATRALQRFDLGRLRSTDRVAAERSRATSPEPAAAIARTTRMSIPPPVKALVSTARMSVPASIRFLEPQVQATAVATAPAVVDAKGVVRRITPLHVAAWVLAASASLVGAGSLVTVLVYALVFP
jgi:hypothetical protein